MIKTDPYGVEKYNVHPYNLLNKRVRYTRIHKDGTLLIVEGVMSQTSTHLGGLENTAFIELFIGREVVRYAEIEHELLFRDESDYEEYVEKVEDGVVL